MKWIGNMNVEIYNTPDSRKLEAIFLMTNDKTYGQQEAADIVGGLPRLLELIGKGLIRTTTKSKSKHAKWYCNASDVLRHAEIRYKRKRKPRKNEKVNSQRNSA